MLLNAFLSFSCPDWQDGQKQKSTDILTIIHPHRLNLCLLSNLAYFYVVFYLFQNQLFQKILLGIPSECMSNILYLDQARQNVGPDLGPNCLLRISTDDSRQRVKLMLGLNVFCKFGCPFLILIGLAN